MSSLRLAKKRPVNPFDQITEREEEEHKRVASEVAAMQKEEAVIRSALAAKEEEYEHGLRDHAHAELEEFRRTTLQEILHKAERDAAKETEELDRVYNQRKPKLIQQVADRLLSTQ